MIAFDFGNKCFNISASEQDILLVVASQKEFSSLDDFITAALKFLESDERFYDNWTEMYENRINSPAPADDVSWMESRFNEMNERVHILYEPIVNAVHVIPPAWNNITLGLETENEYILYLWGTSV
ncbi:hypothetical protein [uncultured Acetatifactor sp.]|uniref:hypothetical protein n=1 Tax=uncultured Acetatifactor sp. TaxID=1671927 RepID=UPI002617A86E|nr:hypothetical protein [uncultured Acetatifactor sp.]